MITVDFYILVKKSTKQIQTGFYPICVPASDLSRGHSEFVQYFP